MKSKLSLSLAFATILMASSFSAFADAPQKLKVDRSAAHKADHSDGEGVATLFTATQFKILKNGKMVPVGAPQTHVRVDATKEMHDAHPDIANDAVKAMSDDPETLFSLTSLLGPIKTLVTTGITAVKGLLSNKDVQGAIVGGGIGIAASVVGGLAGGAAQSATAPAAVPAQ